jgi:hypothetical protein
LDARWLSVGAVVAGLGLAEAWAQVVVTPRCTVLQGGETCLLHARLLGHGGRGCDPHAAIQAWRWTLPEGGPGSIQGDSGLFSAPSVTGIQTIRVRATHRLDPETFGEATVTVLPEQPFGLVRKVLGQDWVEAYSQDLPFRDLATGGRFPGRGQVRYGGRLERRASVFRTGYGLPCSLRWPALPGAQAQLLSFRLGDEVVRRDVTGQGGQVATFYAPVQDATVESLHPLPDGPDLWRSRVQRLVVDVRGLFPFAGNPAAEGRHADGRGALGIPSGDARDQRTTAARFREAFDGVWARGPAPWGGGTGMLFVTDPRAHVLRRVTPEGVVSTFCGEPDQPGHQDSPGLLRSLAFCLGCRRELPVPRFSRPTHLTFRYLASLDIHGAVARELLVSDSGNHAIRCVDSSGGVRTLAGTPGLAGHRDAERPSEALFNDPRGIAADPRGRVFVADRGNQVIRRISRCGRVTTLAGNPGQAGSEDGFGAAARFRDLKGLAYRAAPGMGGTLFVLDGHAVRTVSLSDGEVRTVVGRVDAPGFRDVPSGEMAGPTALKQPCLRDPMGIWAAKGYLLIADQGNHAIRWVHLPTATLVTLAGDPGTPVTRWGLLRDGIPGPLPGTYAALEAPSAVIPGPGGAAASLLVCAGRGLAEIRDRIHLRDVPAVVGLECSPVLRWDEPRTVRFRVLTTDGQGEVTARPVHYSVDFLDPGGDLAEHHEGQGSSADLLTVRGAFTTAGQGAVIVRCVTDQGVSNGARMEVQLAE